MLGDINLIFGMRVYNHKLQVKFEIRSGWMILANLQQLGFEIWPNILLSPLYFTMIWDIDLIFGMTMRVYIIISYRFWNLLRLNDFWPTYSRLGFEIWPNI